MGVLVFLLALVLLAAGAASAYMGLDLLPTGPGLLYVFSGAVAAVGAVVVLALGVVAVQLGRLTQAVREQAANASASAAGLAGPAARQAGEASLAAAQEPDPEAGAVTAAAHEDEIAPDRRAAPDEGAAEAGAETQAVEGPAPDDEPVNENRAGHLPTLDEIERAIETPEPPPTLIGRYSSGGANYMIFSDGTIEAETDEGAYKFATMGDFKQFLLDRNASKA
ncbi:hypothetical protein DFR50_10861 [Roseiarcus fermentans]|uniref:Uncharacterized protein n=1 Tax=Roseiarcus fermentans TaxID=1473586 RepID=A0A366FP65_9HYPH|nr:hypothetical protein [Roseiarcus fermentans]RBP15505.1 hypothetical protein DFR50_10861 [Roseiarcus fermentans]